MLVRSGGDFGRGISVGSSVEGTDNLELVAEEEFIPVCIVLSIMSRFLGVGNRLDSNIS